MSANACELISELSNGRVCELGGKDIVRAANCQLARSAELPSHRVSVYLKGCATVCLRGSPVCALCQAGQGEGAGWEL